MIFWTISIEIVRIFLLFYQHEIRTFLKHSKVYFQLFVKAIKSLEKVSNKTHMEIIPMNQSIKRDENSVVHRSITKIVSSRWDNHEINVYKNEKKWLRLLMQSPRFPNPILFDDIARIITTQYCGEKINKDNFPINIIEQAQDILHELKKYNCNHNDIKPDELLVEKGKLFLVDFGWAIEMGESIPKSWPQGLGGQFKCDPLNDDISMYRSLGYIICKVTQQLLYDYKLSVKKITEKVSSPNPVKKVEIPKDLKIEDEVEWWKKTIAEAGRL